MRAHRSSPTTRIVTTDYLGLSECFVQPIYLEKKQPEETEPQNPKTPLQHRPFPSLPSPPHPRPPSPLPNIQWNPQNSMHSTPLSKLSHKRPHLLNIPPNHHSPLPHPPLLKTPFFIDTAQKNVVNIQCGTSPPPPPPPLPFFCLSTTPSPRANF